MNNVNDVQKVYKKVDEYYNNKNYKGAKLYLEDVLEKAKLDGDMPLIVAAGNEVAGMYRAAANVEKAISVYELVLSTLEKMGMEGTANYAMAQMNAGNAYVVAGLWNKALDVYHSAKQLFAKHNVSDYYTTATLNNNISQAYLMVGKTDEAEAAAFEALINIRKLLPDTYPELATTYSSIAEIRLSQGRAEDACVYFNKANDIFIEKLQGKDIHYASTCYGLGKALLSVGDIDGAKDNFIKAMELIKRDFGENDNYKLVKKALTDIA